jgi:hypothetical protein
VCTYLTVHLEAEGSAKGAAGWQAINSATVYFDHPVHAMADHTLNIDFASESGPRVGIELTAATARELAAAIETALAAAPAALTA